MDILPIPLLPAVALSFLPFHAKLSHLLFDVVSDLLEGAVAIADPEVIHPTLDDCIN